MLYMYRKSCINADLVEIDNMITNIFLLFDFICSFCFSYQEYHINQEISTFPPDSIDFWMKWIVKINETYLLWRVSPYSDINPVGSKTHRKNVDGAHPAHQALYLIQNMSGDLLSCLKLTSEKSLGSCSEQPGFDWCPANCSKHPYPRQPQTSNQTSNITSPIFGVSRFKSQFPYLNRQSK